MNAKKEFVLPERNPKTHAEHRREVFWQITVPLLVGILLFLAAVAGIIFSATQPASEVGRWADISLVWLILPALVIALLFFVLLAGLVYAITKLLGLTPRYAHLVQLYFERGKEKVRQITHILVEPFIKAHSLSAAARQAGRSVKKQVDELITPPPSD
jgi:hypothetical protein